MLRSVLEVVAFITFYKRSIRNRSIVYGVAVKLKIKHHQHFDDQSKLTPHVSLVLVEYLVVVIRSFYYCVNTY